MKTYKEMARDVLRRRDEELRSIQTADTAAPNDVTLDVATPAAGRKHGLKGIIIPGTAVVTAAAVGLTIWHNTGLLNRSSCESGNYSFSEFRGNPTQNPIIGEVYDYPGGKTEININRATWKVSTTNINTDGVYHDHHDHDDLIAIPDDEINGFYGIEFDRLTKHLDGWRVEHEPFGYYSCDEETSDTISHKPHGYYSKNIIHYYGDADTAVNVVAEFSDTPWSSEFAETDKKSLINGFDAVIYNDAEGRYSGDVAYIRMNGVNVCISVEYVCEERFIELLDIFTSPSPDSKNYPADRVNILDRRPAELSNNDPFICGCFSEIEGLKCKEMALNYVSFYYGFDFGRLGKRYSSWKVSGTESLATYYVMDSEPGSSPQIVHDINTLYYTTDNGADLEVSATLAKLPSCEGSSYINGYYVIIYRDPDAYLASESIREHDNDTRDRLTAYIRYGHVTAKIFAAGLSDSEFTDVIKAFTTPLEQSGETETSGDKINILDGVPEYIRLKHGFYRGRCINVPVTQIAYSKDELNEFYGIEFDRLGRLHEDWNEYISRDLGVFVSENDGEQKYESTLNDLYYYITDDKKIDLGISAVLIGEPEEMFSPFDSSVYDGPDIFSKINGKNALIWHYGGEDDDGYMAIIEMGKTLVMIYSGTFSEDEFLSVLEEYTKESEGDKVSSEADRKQNNIKLRHALPEEYENPFDQFAPTNTPDLSECDFELYPVMDVLSSYYGIEFDRLTKLHGDWKEEHGDFGLYSRINEPNLYEQTWTCNAISYTLPNGATLTVKAKRGDSVTQYDSMLEYKDMVKSKMYSTVNGYTALLSRGTGYDDVIYPDEEDRISAVIDMGPFTTVTKATNTFVYISAKGLTDEEFINILKEFTAV